MIKERASPHLCLFLKRCSSVHASLRLSGFMIFLWGGEGVGEGGGRNQLEPAQRKMESCSHKMHPSPFHFLFLYFILPLFFKFVKRREFKVFCNSEMYFNLPWVPEVSVIQERTFQVICGEVGCGTPASSAFSERSWWKLAGRAVDRMREPSLASQTQAFPSKQAVSCRLFTRPFVRLWNKKPWWKPILISFSPLDEDILF